MSIPWSCFLMTKAAGQSALQGPKFKGSRVCVLFATRIGRRRRGVSVKGGLKVSWSSTTFSIVCVTLFIINITTQYRGFRLWPTIPFKIIIIKADGNYSCHHSLCMWSSCANQSLTIADNWIKNKDFSVHWSWPSWHVNKTESHFMPVLSRSIKPSALYKIESVKVDVLSHSVERPQPLVLFKLSHSTKWPWLSLYFLCFVHNFTKLMIIVHQDRIQVSVLSLPMQLME